jgi:MoaA/NifB/PqqE/SkfB family radical SAM enzyme
MCDVGMFNEEGMFFKNLRINRKLQEIDIDVFKRVIDEVASDRPFIAINSTEPLMYKELPTAIRHCSDRRLGTAVTTGAYTLPMRAEELAEAGLTRLNVSIDGPPKVHNHIRGRDDSFERSTEGIRRYDEACRRRGRKPEILINCTITNMNFDKLVELYEQLEPLPITRLAFTYMWFIDEEMAREHNAIYGDTYPVTASCYSEFIDPRAVDIDVLSAQIECLQPRPKVSFLPYFSRDQLYRYFKEPSKFVSEKGRCVASWFFLQILADGNVIVYTRCHNKPIGNIYNQSIEDIWRGPEMQRWRGFIRSVQKMPMCKRCDIAY